MVLHERKSSKKVFTKQTKLDKLKGDDKNEFREVSKITPTVLERRIPELVVFEKHSYCVRS